MSPISLLPRFPLVLSQQHFHIFVGHITEFLSSRAAGFNVRDYDISSPKPFPLPLSLPPITVNPCLTLNCDQDQLKPCLFSIAISLSGSQWWEKFVCLSVCWGCDYTCVCAWFCACVLKERAVTESHPLSGLCLVAKPQGELAIDFHCFLTEMKDNKKQ